MTDKHHNFAINSPLKELISETLSLLAGNETSDFMITYSGGRDAGFRESEISLLPCDGIAPDLAFSENIASLCDEFKKQRSDVASPAGIIRQDYLFLPGWGDQQFLDYILVIPDTALAECLDRLAAPHRLHPAEHQLAKQILAGFNLSAAAEADAVSHETKRSQYKSLARKLTVRSQTELITKIMTAILVELNTGPSATAKQSDSSFVRFIQTYIPSARVLQVAGRSGRMFRMVDIGPVDGRPTVMLHSQILPDLREADMAILHEHRLRVIIPMRNGALSQADDQLEITAHLDYACEAIELARETFCGEQVHLMAVISGSAYGVEYARRYPGRVGSAAFVGACVKPNVGKGTAGRLRHGLLSLAMRNWTMYSKAIAFYGQRINRPGALERLLSNVYRPSVADAEVIRAEYDLPFQGERIRRFFTSSVESIKHDFYHQAHPRWHLYPSEHIRTSFIHGSSDFIHALNDVRALAETWNGAPVYALPAAGQLLYHRSFQPLITQYSRFRDMD